MYRKAPLWSDYGPIKLPLLLFSGLGFTVFGAAGWMFGWLQPFIHYACLIVGVGLLAWFVQKLLRMAGG